MMYRTYDKRGDNQMSFDIFVQSCISLKRMTDIFKKYDSDRDGFITLSFEEFLTGEFPGGFNIVSAWPLLIHRIEILLQP